MVWRGERTKYVRVLQSMVKGTGIRVQLPIVGFIGRQIPGPTFQDMCNSHSWLADYAWRAATASRSKSGSKNMFATIVEAAEKGEHLDDDDDRFEASAMIIAGTDTTAVSLTYLVGAVLQQPTLQRALEQEVASLPNNFTDQDTEDLPILSSTIAETLRLYCAAPGGLPRSVPDEGVALDGYYFPPGQRRDDASIHIPPRPDRHSLSRCVRSHSLAHDRLFPQQLRKIQSSHPASLLPLRCRRPRLRRDPPCAHGAAARCGGVLSTVQRSSPGVQYDDGEYGDGELLFGHAKGTSVRYNTSVKLMAIVGLCQGIDVYPVASPRSDCISDPIRS